MWSSRSVPTAGTGDDHSKTHQYRGPNFFLFSAPPLMYGGLIVSPLAASNTCHPFFRKAVIFSGLSFSFPKANLMHVVARSPQSLLEDEFMESLAEPLLLFASCFFERGIIVL